MKYNEWRDELKNNLLSVNESERQRVLDYYAEAYADRREAGFSERGIIEEFGAPYDAAQRILTETAKTETEVTPEPEPAPTPASEPAQVTPVAPVTPAFVSHTAAPAPAKTKKSNRGWIIGLSVTAAVIVLLVAIILPVRSACRAANIKFTMSSYESATETKSIKLDIDAGSVKTQFYGGDKILIEYPVADVYKTSVYEENDELVYTAHTKRILFFSPRNVPDVVIKLPQNFAADIKANIDAGSLTIADGKYNNIDLDIDAGSAELGITECENLNVNIDAGALFAKEINCLAVTCDVNAGDVEIKKLTCSSLKVSVDMGAATIGLTGAKSEYNITASCHMGSSNLSSQTVAGAEKNIDVSVNMGGIDCSFDN